MLLQNNFHVSRIAPMADALALKQYMEIHNWIADRWPVNAMDIIRENNAVMYKRMGQLTDAIDALIAVENKTKAQKKEFADLLAAFKRIHELGMTYAARHVGASVEAI